MASPTLPGWTPTLRPAQNIEKDGSRIIREADSPEYACAGGCRSASERAFFDCSFHMASMVVVCLGFPELRSPPGSISSLYNTASRERGWPESELEGGARNAAKDRETGALNEGGRARAALLAIEEHDWKSRWANMAERCTI